MTGAGGLSAAVTAAFHGLKVVVAETAPQPTYSTSTRKGTARRPSMFEEGAMKPVTIAVAITGSVPRKEDNPAVPTTLAEARAALGLGAAE